MDAAAEGPFRLGKQTGSFLVNYRYSTLSIIPKLGVNIGDATTDFQDLSFSIWMPAGKLGTFTLFGIGGLSDQKFRGQADSTRQSLSFGYGTHGQMQPLGAYFAQVEQADGTLTQPNKSLGFTKAQHFVLSFDQSLPGNWHVKPELYYQIIANAPVNRAEKDAFSVLNIEGGFRRKPGEQR